MLEKIIKIGILLSLFTPLVISQSTFYPYIFGKAIFFQILIEILLIFYLVLIIQKPEFRPKLNPLNITLLIYFSVFILTTLTGLDPIRSFWSTQERMTGTFNLLHFGAFFLILGNVFKSKRDWFWLLRISLLASALVSIYELFHLESNLGSTLGNNGFLATYLLFNIFFALFLIIKDEKLIWRIPYGLILALNLFIFYYIHKRAAYVGLFAGFFLFLFSSIFTLKSRKRWLALTLLAIFLIASAYIFWNQKESFLVGDKSREISWGISWNAWRDRFLFGWGPENYIYAFAKHFDPEYAEYAGEWFDKAHNQIFETAVTTGLIGFLSYLAVFLIALYNFFRQKNFLFISLLVAYFITNLFWFDTTSSLIPLFITLSLCQKNIFS